MNNKYGMNNRCCGMDCHNGNRCGMEQPPMNRCGMEQPPMKQPPMDHCHMEDNKCHHHHKPIGMGYVPVQKWKDTYCIQDAFCKGTIFPELDLPFLGCVPNCGCGKGGRV